MGCLELQGSGACPGGTGGEVKRGGNIFRRWGLGPLLGFSALLVACGGEGDDSAGMMGAPAPGQAGSAGSSNAAAGTAAGTGNETTADETAPLSFRASDGTTCVCSNETEFGYGQRLTLECFQDAFSACSPTLETLAGDNAKDARPWVYTRHEGCGHTTFNMNGGFGGATCIYDSATELLIGATMSTDTGFKQCGYTAILRAGVQDTCQEGTLCSESGGDSSCVEAAALCAGKPQPCTPSNLQ